MNTHSIYCNQNFRPYISPRMHLLTKSFRDIKANGSPHKMYDLEFQTCANFFPAGDNILTKRNIPDQEKSNLNLKFQSVHFERKILDFHVAKDFAINALLGGGAL